MVGRDLFITWKESMLFYNACTGALGEIGGQYDFLEDIYEVQY